MKKLSWRVFFLLLSAAYLIPEAIFNAQLVSLVGLGTPKPEQLEHLEIYGRTISGIGVTLLLADLLPARLFKTGLRGSLTLLLLTLCVWPSVFFGQKYLIEQWLIEPSTPEQRQYAAYSAALRDALAVNAVEVEGLNYDPKELHSSENLTFLALFGGLAYADHNLTDNWMITNRRSFTTSCKSGPIGTLTSTITTLVNSMMSCRPAIAVMPKAPTATTRLWRGSLSGRWVTGKT